MDKSIKKCLLCLEREASQKNSHIIPKFLGEKLFAESKPRHSLLFSSNGKLTKVQDTPKEDHIICQECEKGFNIYETYCSFKLNRYNDVKYRNVKNFGNIRIGEIECFYPKYFNILIFNLFIYSIVWRASVSKSDAFQNFKLSDENEEILRILLKKYSSFSQDELMAKLKSLKELPSHCHFIMRPIKNLKTPGSGLYLKKINENFYHLGLVEYSLFYYTDKHAVFPGFESMDNNRLEGFVIFGLLSKEVWQNSNEIIIKALLNRPS
jgi:hypothetical protein